MHPPLHRPHPNCKDVIDALLLCHNDNPYAKFLGACNDEKVALDKCFRVEKEERRRANFEQSRKDDEWSRIVAQKEKEAEAATKSSD